LNTVYGLCHRLALKIRESSYKPDVIVAISRGGFVPARLLCDFLNVSDMVSVRVKHYEAGAKKLKQAYVKYSLPANLDLQKSRVLIVDDVNDTGESLEAAVQHVSLLKPAGLKTAVLHQKETTKWDADYYALAVRKWLWIVYPWAATEDIGSFIKQMKSRPRTPQAIAERLKQECGIRISMSWLQKILRVMGED
jgi:hypoxanthine phosphoribosyltransferase